MRRRLLYVLVAFGVGASLTWWFRTPIFLALLDPARGQLSGTGRPVFTSPTEMFTLVVGMAVKGGLVIALPVLAFNLFRLFRHVLDRRQRRLIAAFIVMGFAFYLAGAAFAYFVLLPTGLGFLLGFGTDVATPMVRITEYMELAIAMMFWLGVVFEIPIVMLLLAKLRLVSHRQFKKARRYVPIAALILGMIMTPTVDYVTQALVAVPIILLYEAGMVLSWLARPKTAAG